MKRIIIICLRYLDEKENDVTIGGIQTYITNLIDISKDLGLKCIVVQPSNHSFCVTRNNVEIIGVLTSENKGFIQFKKKLFKVALHYYHDGDIVLFATERLSVRSNIQHTIAIQHGISWDVTDQKQQNAFLQYLFMAKRAIKAAALVRDSLRVKKLVCVDYNYINWLRTQVKSLNLNYVTIPNFSVVPQEKPEKKDNSIIKIIFARRLQEFRGTKLFCRAIKRIFNELSDVEVTIAGDGPDEPYLKKELEGYNVSFITYSSKETLLIHKDKHIAVVPSLGSEGTSLSLIEAMASGCAPIATDIGGMTNIIIDHYNGLLIKPDVDCLYNALKCLILHNDYRKRIADNAYKTAEQSFSFEKWREAWTKVIREEMGGSF